MSASFTPGPWEIRSTETGSRFTKNWREIWSGFQNPVVTAAAYNSSVDGEIGGVQISESNARLIAAAPDLLAALVRIRDGVPAFHEGEFVTLQHDGDGNELGFERHDPAAIIQSIVGVACDAITKATGEEAA